MMMMMKVRGLQDKLVVHAATATAKEKNRGKGASVSSLLAMMVPIQPAGRGEVRSGQFVTGLIKNDPMLLNYYCGAVVLP